MSRNGWVIASHIKDGFDCLIMAQSNNGFNHDKGLIELKCWFLKCAGSAMADTDPLAKEWFLQGYVIFSLEFPWV